MKNFQLLNHEHTPWDMTKRELSFQVEYNQSSKVKYIDCFEEVRPIFTNPCGEFTQISVKENAYKTYLEFFLRKNSN